MIPDLKIMIIGGHGKVGRLGYCLCRSGKYPSGRIL